MASIVIKDVPAQLHTRLKRQAAQNRRSMNREAILLLDASLPPNGTRVGRLPRPVQLRDPKSGRPILMTDAMLREARREGRG